MSQSQVVISESKQRWSVIIGNLLVAGVSIWQMVLILVNKGNYGVLFVVFAFPGFYFYVSHKHDITLFQILLISLGLNRELKKIKGYLLGVVGGFVMGWHLMFMNIIRFVRSKISEGRTSRQILVHQKPIKDIQQGTNTRLSQDIEEITCDSDTDSEMVQDPITDIEAMEMRSMLKQERPVREGR
ncbi:hypothetical protein POF51_26405 [Brevibacillus sp. AG]|uniref:hypothetical protein n=1 Tax=Brevibacillus sp. AG TaxID=3020891 RepID=UPI00232AE7ED|nr:hypothetical protein [Brevibacillus sp. AG]MDC0764256.1 hypothetical protein [Brevibacillus sp. AG]